MDNDYQSVLQRLREERRRRNLTQRLLGYCMGMQQDHYSKAETGHGYFPYRELKGLCTSDVDVLYVFIGKRPRDERQFIEPIDSRRTASSSGKCMTVSRYHPPLSWKMPRGCGAN